jgi:hypothetical protein
VNFESKHCMGETVFVLNKNVNIANRCKRDDFLTY